MNNRLKTTFFLALLTCLLVLVGHLIGGTGGMLVFFIFAVIMNIGAWWFSDKIVLAIYRAKPVDPSHELYSVVRNLATKARLPLPRVYLVPADSLNAFATGRNPEHSAVAITQGLLRSLSSTELEGVLAHELSHIKNRDTLIQCVAATIAGAIMMVASAARWAALFGGLGGRDNDRDGGAIGFLFLAIVAPLAAVLIQLAISRSREYLADSSGAKLAGSPHGLATALEKISSAAQRIPLQANPATAPLFIVNPLTGKSFINLFATHPPVEERIKRLIKRIRD